MRARRLAARLALAALAPIAFLALAEGGLALAGAGEPVPFFTTLPNDPTRKVRTPRYRAFWAAPPAPFLAT
ncbi:MAG TPA: hypothetical protein VKE69_12205, partial [Planctomycetota bacterium]|nr:hypothetical protein [Planctomycetota bacterium]